MARCDRARRSSELVSAGKAMASQAAQHLEAVGAFLRQIQGTPSFSSVLEQQRAHWLQQLEALPAMTVAEAGAVASAIIGGPWPPEVSSGLLEVAARKSVRPAGGEASLPSMRRPLQDFRRVVAYINAKTWVSLQSEATPERKLDILLDHLLQLGLRLPTEATFQVVTALFLAVTEGLERATGQGPAVKYNTLQFIKKGFKRCVRNSVEPPIWIAELPCDPRDCRSSFPAVWAVAFPEGEFPVACPIDAVGFGALVGSVPMRKTHKSMGPAPTTCGDAQMAPMVQMMQMMFQHLQALGGKAQASPGGGGGADLDIRFLTPPCKALPPAPTHTEPKAPSEPTLPAADDWPLEEVSPKATSALCCQPLELDQPVSKRNRMSVDMTTQIIADAIAKRNEAKAGVAKSKAKSEGKAQVRAGAKLDVAAHVVERQPMAKEAKSKQVKEKAKGKAKAKATAKTSTKATTKAKTPQGPRFSVEYTRDQVICRGASPPPPPRPPPVLRVSRALSCLVSVV